MAKRVSVIDIGSNSIRMAIYERTSRFAFHILYETKSKVKLSQDTYTNNSYLQEEPMQRAISTLRDFLSISKSFNARKTLCVATSALREAPNKQDFISQVRSTLKLNIKVIDGQREAYLGAIACANLLPVQKNALSIDIGGGSSEFSLIDTNNVSNTFSLELGTLRLKELYFQHDNIQGAVEYIDLKLECLNHLNPDTLIGIGGTFRALSNAIMKSLEYPLNKTHAFECSPQEFVHYIDLILKSDEKNLEVIGIKKNRVDLIKPGVLILQRLLKKISFKKIITSGVGVREGVYLGDLLRHSKDKLPHNYNTSLRYIIDSNINNANFSNNLSKLSKELFDLSYEYLGINKAYRYELAIASKLYPSGSNIHFFSQNRHTYYLIKSALEYGFTHSQIMLIATLTRYAKNKLPSKRHIKKYESLLPKQAIINSLSYIISLSIALLSHKPRNLDFSITFKEGVFNVNSKNKLYLCKESVKKINQHDSLKVVF